MENSGTTLLIHRDGLKKGRKLGHFITIYPGAFCISNTACRYQKEHLLRIGQALVYRITDVATRMAFYVLGWLQSTDCVCVRRVRCTV